MSEITMKTIETLPLVEEPAESASLVGWNNGQTVRMPVGAVGGSGTKGIVFTYRYEEGSSSNPMSIEPLVSIGGTYILSCNYEFDECYELLMAGAPVVFVDTNRGTVTSMVSGQWSTGGSTASVLGSAPSELEIYLVCVHLNNPNFHINYSASSLYGEYESSGGDA